ncbi:MAG: ATP-binding protein [Pseudomonadota bacterium]
MQPVESADPLPVGEASAASFIIGGGETGALMRSMDWEKLPLGAPRFWAQSLRTAIDICLSSRFPIALYWGPEYLMLYNDDLLPMVGANKHPWALGRPAREVLSEIWSIIGPLLDSVVETGRAIWSENLMLPLLRSRAQEESYFTFTYSPVHNEAGQVGGVLCAVLETTDKVIEERRLRLLNALANATIAKTKEEACAIVAKEMTQAPNDVPFALLYLLDSSSQLATLVGSSQLDSGTVHSPAAVRLGEGSIWPFSTALEAHEPIMVALDDGPFSARGAVVLRIERSGGGAPFGFIVAGLSPMLRSGESYTRFHNLLAASISQSVSGAAAYEEEKKRAESLAELDRAKTAFFGNVSHEFRTPLTLILAPLEELVAGPDGAHVDRATVELLHRNALRLQKLVNTLLEFSRIEAGRVEAAYEPLDLGELTTELASGFRDAIERAGLTLIVDCPGLGEPIYVDRDMWEKIVLNLLSNALKFTFEGTISVALRLEEQSACLTVSDTGTGIEQRELPHLFDRFHRIEGARSRSHEGSGIGLALLQELVRLHGGQVGIASEVGAGTTFRVRIPRGFAHLPADRVRPAHFRQSTALGPAPFLKEAARWSPRSESQAPPPGTGSTTSERIIFADDNADMRDYVTRLLSARWQVETVADGTAALSAIRQNPPALALLDVMMPGLDGTALVRVLREDMALQTLPVMLLSARAGDEATESGLASGADDYLVKPFSARELVARVATQIALGQARRAERDAQERLRAIFRQAPVAVSVVRGPEFVYELANQRYEVLVGRRDIVGRSIRDVFRELPADAPVFQMLERVRRSGEAFTATEYTVPLDRSGTGKSEDVIFHFSCQPVLDVDGTVDTILTVAIDVTEQVSSRRTVERLARREEAARRAAEEASRAKDEFLSTLSHELRTPLNAVVGWSHLLRTGAVPEDQRERAFETIERNARAQAKLIEDMLDLSRIAQGKLVLAVGPVEMVRVVEAALDSVRLAADAKGVRLQPVLDSHATIVGDADRLQQVVWNLLSNAIKFTPKRGRVQVRVSRKESYVEVAVADNGQGIAAEFLPHVFDRFRQADGAMNRQAGGLGLGLAIVRSLVELHGGSVTAASDGLGQGATFTVRLPMAPLRRDSTPSALSEPGLPTSPTFECPPALRNLRALVVDDEKDTRELIAFVLGQCEVRVTLAGSASEAVAALAHERFDVLISDIGMPGEDGLALIRRLRRLPPALGGQIPALALTAYARSEDRIAALKAGFQMHLAKPIEPTDLLVTIATLVGGYSSG